MESERRVSLATPAIPENRFTDAPVFSTIPNEPGTWRGGGFDTPPIMTPMPNMPTGAAQELTADAATTVTEYNFEEPHNPAADQDAETRRKLPTQEWPVKDFT